MKGVGCDDKRSIGVSRLVMLYILQGRCDRRSHVNVHLCGGSTRIAGQCLTHTLSLNAAESLQLLWLD